jgi:hypothetical protein
LPAAEFVLRIKIWEIFFGHTKNNERLEGRVTYSRR